MRSKVLVSLDWSQHLSDRLQILLVILSEFLSKLINFYSP